MGETNYSKTPAFGIAAKGPKSERGVQYSRRDTWGLVGVVIGMLYACLDPHLSMGALAGWGAAGYVAGALLASATKGAVKK